MVGIEFTINKNASETTKIKIEQDEIYNAVAGFTNMCRH